MVAFNKFNQFAEDIYEGVHDFSADALTLALTAAANAPVATNSVLADLTQISYTNLSTRVLANVTSVGTSGTLTVDADDITLTASGGAVATFRYIVLFNDTPTSPADPLIAWYDYGTDVTLADGQSLVITWNASGILTHT